MIRVVMEKVLIVGAGPTGAITSSLLKQSCPGFKTVVWEKSHGSGGRMTTSRSSHDPRCTVDLGAQYLSVTPDYASKHAELYDELLSEGVLKPLSGFIEGHEDKITGTKNYVMPKGVSSLVKHFLFKADTEIVYDHTVTNINLCGDGKRQWIVSADSGANAEFDVVILTLPVPQILQLQGEIHNIIDAQQDIKSSLLDVSYSSRYALGLFYPPATDLNIPWCAKYITDNPCIRYVAVDNKKRANEEEGVGPSLAIHTSVPFGIEHLEKDKDDVVPLIMQHLRDVLPNIPPATEIKCHKWRFSQVHKPYPGSPGCVIVSKDPPLILAGDGFMHSNFDGCIESALAVQNAILSLKNMDKSS